MELYLKALSEPGAFTQVKRHGRVFSIRAALVGNEIASAVFLGDDYLDTFSLMIVPIHDTHDEENHYVRIKEVLKLMEAEVISTLG